MPINPTETIPILTIDKSLLEIILRHNSLKKMIGLAWSVGAEAFLCGILGALSESRP
jgi:hypothetical protein